MPVRWTVAIVRFCAILYLTTRGLWLNSAYRTALYARVEHVSRAAGLWLTLTAAMLSLLCILFLPDLKTRASRAAGLNMRPLDWCRDWRAPRRRNSLMPCVRQSVRFVPLTCRRPADWLTNSRAISVLVLALCATSPTWLRHSLTHLTKTWRDDIIAVWHTAPLLSNKLSQSHMAYLWLWAILSSSHSLSQHGCAKYSGCTQADLRFSLALRECCKVGLIFNSN